MRRRSGIVGWGGVCLAWLALACVAVGQNETDEERQDVFRRAPRDVSLPLSRAREAIEQQRYSEAAELLGHLLSSEVIGDSDAQDFFLSEKASDGRLIRLREEASRLLSTMPSDGRQWYELQFGAVAKALFDEAVAAGSESKLAEVVRKYFHTEAGHDATMVLGRHQLSQGSPLAAALTFRRLLDSPQAGRYQPELSLLLATSWLYSNMPDEARTVLVQLKRADPDRVLQIGDEKIQLFRDDEDALVWFDRMIGQRHDLRQPRPLQWVLHRGNAARNAEAEGSLPLLNHRWQQRVANDPQDEALLTSITKQFSSQRVTALPVLHPLVVDKYVLMRTTDQLWGVDFATGKIAWVPLSEESSGGQSLASGAPEKVSAIRQEELQQRVFSDAVYGQLSSDGRSVFYLDELGFQVSTANNVFVGIQGQLRSNPRVPKSHNLLVAVDVQSQGKLRWLVGGINGEDEPKLAGAFFLGAPLPMEGKLYVLAEVNGEIRLVVLDAQTGTLLWYQQLVHVDDSHILLDAGRRLAGASPSYAGGVLICPTSAGAVVAIDVARRCLLWGYAYPRDTDPPKSAGFSAVIAAQLKEIGSRWADATVTIDQGRVLLTPVESDKLFCLDLLTGELLWQAPRAEMQFVACVHQGRVVLVASHQVLALDLETGKPAWPQAVELGTEQPGGRGFLSGDHYYLATTGSELLRIDVVAGTVAARSPTMRPLGNLVCYQDYIISQGPDFLAVYYQTEPLRARVDQWLQQDPQDAEALALRGELLLHDGRRAEAVATLQTAHQLDPDNDTTRSLLVRTVLAAMRDDFQAHVAYAEQIEPLIDQPDQMTEYLGLLAEGYQQRGELDRAFSAYLKLAWRSLPSGALVDTELNHLSREHAVRRDRWVQARLTELLRVAGQEERGKMQQAVQQRLDEILADGTVFDLRRFVGYFDGFALADRARAELARRHLAAKEYLEAETLLHKLSVSGEPSTAAPAVAEMAEMLVQARRLAEAAPWYRRLQSEFAQVVCRGGLTGQQIFDQALEDVQLQREIQPADAWPAGQVVVKEGNDIVNTRSIAYRVDPIQLTEVSGGAADGTRVVFDQRQYSALIRDPLGRTDVQVPLQRSDGRRFATANHQLSTAKLHGHLLVMSVGFEVLAIDLLRAKVDLSEAILWREDLRPSLPARSAYNLRVQSRNVETPWGTTRRVALTSSGVSMGELGPLNPTGIVFQRRHELVCVDPVSGAPLWTRSNVPEGSRLFGDAERLFVIPPDEREKPLMQPMLVVDHVDGRLLKQVPRDENWQSIWVTHEGRMLTWKKHLSQVQLSLVDAWTQDVIWQRSFPEASKGCLVETDEIAVLQPDGAFCVMSLRDERPRIEATLEPESKLTDLVVQRNRDQYLVLVQRPQKYVTNVTVQAVPSRNSYSITSALVYALDRQDGRLMWPCPADVENFSFPEDQPPEAPVLTFLRQRTATNSGGGGRTQAASAVCLDKRDGRVVLWKDDVKGSSISQYEVIAQPETQSVSLVLPGKTFTLTFTDQPTPPAPPAHVGSLVPPRSLVDSAGRVAGGILRAITGDAPRRVLKVPIDPFAPEPAKEPAPARRPVNPAPPR